MWRIGWEFIWDDSALGTSDEIRCRAIDLLTIAKAIAERAEAESLKSRVLVAVCAVIRYARHGASVERPARRTIRKRALPARSFA
jgi:hypothetical protein